MEFLPIRQFMNENPEFAANPDCSETLQMSVDYYSVIGYNPPWICYYAKRDGKLVGSAGYKGAPVSNKIEIAYGTFEAERGRGIGAEICRQLVKLALQTNPQLIITARTLPEHNFSTRILQKNNFHLLGPVWDKDDGEVWEWKYAGPSINAW